MLLDLLESIVQSARRFSNWQADVVARLGRIEERLNRMPTKADFDQLIDQFDQATNAVAARLESINARLQEVIDANAGSISAADAAAIQSRLTAEVEQLRALGSDPANPIPEPPPAPAA